MAALMSKCFGERTVTVPTKCYGDKIQMKHISGTNQTEQPKQVESRRLRTENQERYERVKCSTPNGFHEVLQLIIKEVILCRPTHVYRFIADMLDVELTKRTLDDIVYGCLLKKSMKPEVYSSESCRLRTCLLQQTRLEIFGEDQFTMGYIPDYELERPALDRYRDYAGIGVFDMTCCEAPPEPQPIQTEDQCQPAEAEPVRPPSPPAKMHVFDKGPIPDYDMQEPAVDRYRDYAGISPFDLSQEGCVDHEPLCRCMFCTKKDGRSPISSLDEVKLCRAEYTADLDQIFTDSPVYRETQVEDKDAYREGGLDAIAPFGQLFQQGKQFEEDVFEPECPYGEKTFLQEHPMFGDFSVKSKKDPRERLLFESPECACPEAMNDPDPLQETDVENLREVRECAEPKVLNDPENEPGSGPQPLVEDEFEDKAFDSPPAEGQPTTFGEQLHSPEQEQEIDEETPEN